MAQEARRSPPPAKSKEDAEEQLRLTLEEAKYLQEEWGCSGGGFCERELNKDFQTEARHFARVVGVYHTEVDKPNVPTTCPFNTIMRADELTLEVTEACCAMGVDSGFNPQAYEALLGRPITNIDLEAYKTWKRALAESMASDREIDRQEQKAKEATK